MGCTFEIKAPYIAEAEDFSKFFEFYHAHMLSGTLSVRVWVVSVVREVRESTRDEQGMGRWGGRVRDAGGWRGRG